VVGVLRAYEPGVARTEEYLATRDLRTLCEEGLDQGQWLRAGLPPNNAVTGADVPREIDGTQRSSPWSS
jgi:hypothetical protein